MKSLSKNIDHLTAKFPFLNAIKKACVSIDKILDKEIPLLLLLLLVIILRIPNFFEPYWYGDEAIYLTIGNALNNGSAMYADIVDHKTPLIYYFAMVPNQFWFRVLLLIWMLITTAAFYHFTSRLFKKTWLTTCSTFIFIIFTTLPWLEGNIPNGELFVMGFIITGAAILIHTRFIKDFLQSSDSKSETAQQSIQTFVSTWLDKTNDWFLYLISGLLFGLAILTKVPALLDVLAFLSIAGFTISNAFDIRKISSKHFLKLFRLTFFRSVTILLAVTGSIGLSVLYYYLRGTSAAYLEFGLLYNFHYVQTWSLGFDSVLLEMAYTLPGKMAIVIFFLLLIMFFKNWLRPRFQFIASWFVFALFAALLSNRPYPHYFLQVVPPLALLSAELIFYQKDIIGRFLHKSKRSVRSIILRPQFAASLVGISLVTIFIGVLLTLKVGLYPTQSYYVRTFDFLTGKISKMEYYQGFNTRMEDNYHAAEIISKTNDPYLFIWGTNPELYALTKKIPVGRFTVSFHIKDLKLYEETIQAVTDTKPTFIVVMKNEEHELAGLRNLLTEEYIMNKNFTYFELWKKQSHQ